MRRYGRRFRRQSPRAASWDPIWIATSPTRRWSAIGKNRLRAVAPAPAPRPPALVMDGEALGRTALTLGAIAAFVVIVVLRPEFWWVIFFLPAVAGAWGWDRWSHRK